MSVPVVTPTIRSRCSSPSLGSVFGIVAVPASSNGAVSISALVTGTVPIGLVPSKTCTSASTGSPDPVIASDDSAMVSAVTVAPTERCAKSIASGASAANSSM